MANFTLSVLKKNWKRYAWSSFLTFLTGFMVSFTMAVQTFTYENLEASGWIGAVVLVGRLVLKAAFEGAQYLLPIITEKLAVITRKVANAAKNVKISKK